MLACTDKLVNPEIKSITLFPAKNYIMNLERHFGDE